MAKINVDRMAQEHSSRTNVYTPIIEAIVNSIEAIKDKSLKDNSGWIKIKFFRGQLGIGLKVEGETVTPRVTSIEITDNGIGFDEDNFESFNTLHSDYKMSRGGKGFGRVFYRQYFQDVQIESIYKDGNQFKFRSFDFTKNDLVENHKLVDIDESGFDEPTTTIYLKNIKPEHSNKLELRLDTIARKLLEHLLIYFVDESFKCPRITLIDDNTGGTLTLNDTLEKSNEIIEVGSDNFTVKSDVDNRDYTFTAKTFKVFYSQAASSISLTAHQRQVTKTPIQDYMNEYKEGFTEIEQRDKGKKVTKNYIGAVYVLGDYLDSMVSTERGTFLMNNDASMLSPLTTKEIERKAVETVSKYFEKDLNERKSTKHTIVAAHVAKEAPWLRKYVSELDLQTIGYRASPEEINTALERTKFVSDGEVKREIKELISAPPEKEEDIQKAIDAINTKVTAIGKNDLAQYVVLRKTVLDLFNQALKWDEAKKYNKEDAVHSMIFPMNTTSDEIDYDRHNLWMLDERLSFHSYAASDIAYKPKGGRPDILVLDLPILMRDSDTTSSPIYVVEFKRPMREDYSDKYDPLKQIRRYVDEIRTGKAKKKDGTFIAANSTTPAYGFVVCDLTKKIDQICLDAGLVPDPDGEGYHGFHPNWKVYFEVMSFKKLHSNAELRNKVLFHKLGIL